LVSRMIKFCMKGPPGARVIGVSVKWEKYKGEFNSFTVKY